MSNYKYVFVRFWVFQTLLSILPLDLDKCPLQTIANMKISAGYRGINVQTWLCNEFYLKLKQFIASYWADNRYLGTTIKEAHEYVLAVSLTTLLVKSDEAY